MAGGDLRVHATTFVPVLATQVPCVPSHVKGFHRLNRETIPLGTHRVPPVYISLLLTAEVGFGGLGLTVVRVRYPSIFRCHILRPTTKILCLSGFRLAVIEFEGPSLFFCHVLRLTTVVLRFRGLRLVVVPFQCPAFLLGHVLGLSTKLLRLSGLGLTVVRVRHSSVLRCHILGATTEVLRLCGFRLAVIRVERPAFLFCQILRLTAEVFCLGGLWLTQVRLGCGSVLFGHVPGLTAKVLRLCRFLLGCHGREVRRGTLGHLMSGNRPSVGGIADDAVSLFWLGHALRVGHVLGLTTKTFHLSSELLRLGRLWIGGLSFGDGARVYRIYIGFLTLNTVSLKLKLRFS
ncbi:hypothetical protein AGDE_13871 [Angomonas deanei]|uniref:Uncharacterized protein n=1 Tax=Angomonas deanei TaxID=59799 RepID=A0A7G2CHM3_9TRYP|nr:hypothetical protein AGDE_13871 [Angomonas deanei]CAD2219256.1 hypothetical protein, conserved [Angomonas deanei]|eukprot:EPY21682.1 hypothetical protein AGDE_13871 [Angomonas deanei]